MASLRLSIRMLQKLGVLSFSEPYWLENIIRLPYCGIDHDAIGRVSAISESHLSLPLFWTTVPGLWPH